MSKLSLFFTVLVAMVVTSSATGMGRYGSSFSLTPGPPPTGRVIYRRPGELLSGNIKPGFPRPELVDPIGAYLSATKEIKEIGGINLSEHLKASLKNDFGNKKPLARAKELVNRMIAMYKRK